MQRGARQRNSGGLESLLSETQRLVAQLVRENRALKLRNERLSDELDRVSAGWEEIKRLAKSAPRRRRSRS